MDCARLRGRARVKGSAPPSRFFFFIWSHDAFRVHSRPDGARWARASRGNPPPPPQSPKPKNKHALTPLTNSVLRRNSGLHQEGTRSLSSKGFLFNVLIPTCCCFFQARWRLVHDAAKIKDSSAFDHLERDDRVDRVSGISTLRQRPRVRSDPPWEAVKVRESGDESRALLPPRVLLLLLLRAARRCRRNRGERALPHRSTHVTCERASAPSVPRHGKVTATRVRSLPPARPPTR